MHGKPTFKRNDHPVISIVIPTCHRPELLRKNLSLLVPQTADLHSLVEIIVTDDSRNSETKEMITTEFISVNWTEGPRRGPAANRNHGAEQANGDHFIFLDDDVLPDRTFLLAYEAAFPSSGQDNKLLAYEGATIRQKDPPSLLWEAPHNPSGDYLISCNLGMSRSTFDAVGRFDERYPHAAFEDTEFAARFRLKGGQGVFLPQARVIHPLRRRPGARRLAEKWEGRTLFAFDNGASPETILWRLPVHVLRVIQSRFRGQPMHRQNRKALCTFAVEFLLVCWLTPQWVTKWKKHPRSRFWSNQVAKGLRVPKYGF